MKYFFRSPLRKITLPFILVFFQLFSNSYAQNFKVDYKPLPSKLLTGNEPVIICILENTSSSEKLYDGLVQSSEIKNKFTIYSTDVLNDYKSILGIEEFNPDDKNFLNALKDALGVQYLLNWKSFEDADSGYQLAVYSVKSSDKIYDKQFFPSQNSTVFLDVQKLLAENMEPVYTVALAEVEISSNSNETKYKLYRGQDLVKEWTGNKKQNIEAGKYKLISESFGYKADEREINIPGGRPTSIQIDLEEDLNLLPNIYSLDSRLTNIKLEREPDKIKISYDLGADKSEVYNIELGLIDKITKDVIDLKEISGDIEKVKPGANKSISWGFTKELGKNAELKNYELKISVEKSGGLAWYYYAGGGAVVAGGLAAILLGGGGDDNGSGGTPGPQKIGTPPVRPTGD